MNIASYEVRIYNGIGELLTSLPLSSRYILGLSFGLKENEVGVLDLVLTGDFDPDLLAIDNQIAIYRFYGESNGRLQGNTAWFIRRIEFPTDKDGTTTIYVQAFSALDLLARRIIAYPAESAQSAKTGAWDDIIRDIVYENMGAGATDTTRSLGARLTIPANLSLGSSISRGFSYRNVLATLIDILNDAMYIGERGAIEVVLLSPGFYGFRVYVGIRGMDRSSTSSKPLIVSTQRRNLINATLVRDWTTESNAVYALGQGQEEARVVQTAIDTTRTSISPFGRREFAVDARNTNAVDKVLAEARTAVEINRPKQIFTGEITQTEGCVYEIDWEWGDVVTAEYLGLSFDCFVDSVSIMISRNGAEVIRGRLRSVTNVP